MHFVIQRTIYKLYITKVYDYEVQNIEKKRKEKREKRKRKMLRQKYKKREIIKETEAQKKLQRTILYTFTQTIVLCKLSLITWIVQ